MRRSQQIYKKIISHKDKKVIFKNIQIKVLVLFKIKSAQRKLMNIKIIYLNINLNHNRKIFKFLGNMMII